MNIGLSVSLRKVRLMVMIDYVKNHVDIKAA